MRSPTGPQGIDHDRRRGARRVGLKVTSSPLSLTAVHWAAAGQAIALKDSANASIVCVAGVAGALGLKVS